MNDQALYLEADEDITSAIDKLGRTEPGRIQIVAPKRSTLLQSVINLKLLKKSAEEADREIVLVTSDGVVKGLAARLGLAVASSVNGKATVATPPPPPPADTDEIIEETAEEPEVPVTDLAPTDAAAEAAPASKIGSLRLPGVKKSPAPAVVSRPVGDDIPAAPAKADQPKVPNFGKLQRRLFWTGGALVFVAGYFVAMHFLTSATVTLYAAGSKAEVAQAFTVDPEADKSDIEAGILKGETVSVDHELKTTFAATGKKEVGTKAKGEMSITNSTGTDQTLIAGTRFAAPDGKIFRSDAEVVVPAARLNADGDKVNGQASVAVTADQPGDGYNQAPAPYGIPALSSDKIRAQGGQMSGGTSRVVNVVTQADVDKARDTLLERDQDKALVELRGKAPDKARLLESSLARSAAQVVSAPAVGEEAAGPVNLTVAAAYTALAVPEADIAALVRSAGLSALGENKQIYDDGLGEAKVEAAGKKSAESPREFEVSAVVSGGPKIDAKALALEAKGKKYGEAVDIAGGVPGVQRAEVSIRPAWASRLPRIEENITVKLTVAGRD